MKSWAKMLWNVSLDGEHAAVVYAKTEEEAIEFASEQLRVTDLMRIKVTSLDLDENA
jgi:hypothetical protein